MAESKNLCVVWTIKVARIYFGLVLIALGLAQIGTTSPFLQSHMVYLHGIDWPCSVDWQNPEALGFPWSRSVSIDSAGCTLVLWHLEAEKPSPMPGERNASASMRRALRESTSPVVVYFHGNAANLAFSYRTDMYRLFHGMSAHVVTFDYRGFGGSGCSPSEEGLAHDARVVYDWLVGEGVDATRIVLYGHSLGTAVAMRLARDLAMEGALRVGGIVLEAPFTSLAAAVSAHPCALIFKTLPGLTDYIVQHLNEEWDSLSSMKVVAGDAGAHVPILIAHGARDWEISPMMGKELHEAACASRKAHGEAVDELVLVRDAGHNNLPSFDDFVAPLRAFLARAGRLDASP